MSTSLPPDVSPYVPRGPLGHELRGLRHSIIVNNVTTLLIAMFVGFFAVRAFNRVDSAAQTAKKIQAVQQGLVTATAAIQDLQQQQVTSSSTGRAILKLVADQTSPTATAQQQAQVAGYLKQLTDAQKVLNADQLRKLGELAIVLGASPSEVNRILNEPVPVITFGASPTNKVASSPTANSPVPKSSITPSSSSSRSPAVNLQVQCPVVCP